jgi:carboxyl-terminal processing protease
MQNKGVQPDINLPATWDLTETGESSLEFSLPWDQIKPVRFKKFKFNKELMSQLRFSHLQRLDSSPDLQYLLDIRKRYDEQQEKTSLSINISTRQAEKFERQQWALKIENKRRAAKGLEAFKSYDALKKFNEEQEETEIDIDIQTDYLLHEGTLILSDYIYLNSDSLLSEAA